jgi:hypothetical protein
MKYIAVVGIAFILTGCAGNKSFYEWGSYQPALVNYYKNGDASAFEARLNASLEKGERKKRVPPGMHAELGYILYARGDYANAASHFAAEKALFPESTALMDKLIAGSEAGSKKGDQK